MTKRSEEWTVQPEGDEVTETHCGDHLRIVSGRVEYAGDTPVPVRLRRIAR
jgi:hypothetical protein